MYKRQVRTLRGSVSGRIGSKFSPNSGNVHELFGDVKKKSVIYGRVDILHGQNHGQILGGVGEFRPGD